MAAGIKGVGGNQGLGQANSKQPIAGKSFQTVLDTKNQRTEASGTNRIKNTIPQGTKGVKEKLAELLKGGADSKQVVMQALQANPIFKDLPKVLKDDLINKVSEQMEPLLKA